MACFKKEPDRLLQQSIELPRFEAKPLLCLKLNCLWLCTSHSLWEVIYWIMFSIIIIIIIILWLILLVHAAYCMHGHSASSQPFHTMWHAHEILLRAFESPLSVNHMLVWLRLPMLIHELRRSCRQCHRPRWVVCPTWSEKSTSKGRKGCAKCAIPILWPFRI